MLDLTLIGYGNFSVSDEVPFDAIAPEAQFRGAMVDHDSTAITYRMTDAAWEHVRPRIRDLSQRRVAVVDGNGATVSGLTRPAMEYAIVPVPARIPRVTQIEQTAALSLVTNGVLTLRGVNLLGSMPAEYDVVTQSGSTLPGITGQTRFSKGVRIMRLVAVPLGPVGNRIGVRFAAASGAGSVSVKMKLDGEILIDVVPAAGADDVTSVVAQIVASAAAAFVTATAIVGTAKVPPTNQDQTPMMAQQVPRKPYAYLKSGDGGGVAELNFLVATEAPANRLRIVAQKGGCPSNNIRVKLVMDQVGNTVVVSGKTITVNRTGSTETIGNLATAINGNASAAALVAATAIGAGSLNDSDGYLYGGSGEEPVATVGGAAAVVTGHTDTGMVLTVLAADLVTAGVTNLEEAAIQVLMGTSQLQAQVTAGGGQALSSVRARVRAAANVNLATPGANIDGVAMAAGQKFWSDIQTTPAQDGLYIYNGAATPATRAPEVPAGFRASGLLVSIAEGTDLGTVRQVTNAAGADVVGTDNLASAAV